MHDPTKVLTGATLSSDKKIEVYAEDPATFPAGLGVRLSSTGALSLSSGSLVGISMGKSLSDSKAIGVCKSGLKVPVLLTDDNVFSSLVVGDLTFTSKIRGEAGDEITIALVDSLEDGTAVVSVTDLDIVVDIEAAATTALAIKTAIDAHPVASTLVSVAIADGESSTAQAAAAEAALDNGADAFSYVVKGAKVSINDTTGRADEAGSGATATDAVYVSGVLTAIKEDGSEDYGVLIDIAGGL